jgi:hypothetical protein
MQLLTQIGDKLEDLKINLEISEDREDMVWEDDPSQTSFNSRVCESIGELLERCGSLQTLTLYSVHLYDFKSSVANDSLHTVQLVSPWISSDALCQFIAGLDH